MTERDDERRQRLSAAMRQAGLDAVTAALPENVLLLTGYFPVVGTSLALATREGEVFCIAPQDERDLAEAGSADQVLLYEPASLEHITTAVETMREPLSKLLHDHHLSRAIIGYECAETFEPAPYAAMHLYGMSVLNLFERAGMRPLADFFSRMKATLTPLEIERVRRSCRIADLAFDSGCIHLKPGLNEAVAAAPFRLPLFTTAIGFENAVRRADGYVFCMAGVRSSQAFGAYARSRAAVIQPGDLVLTHCNSHADGYWTDITRTYCMGQPDERRRRMYAAVFEARQAAFAAVRPGAQARAIDRAARDVMRAHGFGEQFKHPTGHGVGFCAINHNALPRLHPASSDVLETGMVFNIEPAVYLEGLDGLRHCDMVAVTATGAELLTSNQCTLPDLCR